MKYESDILKRLINTYGVVGNPRYISEIIKEFIIRGKERFPGLFTYQADWLAHIDEFGLNPSYTVSYTGQSIYAPNTLERPVKSAILKGSTKCRDIDTGEVLDAFEDGRNLELVSVKMPGLTTSNEDGTKTNILTVNEPVELRGIGEVKDTLDCLTGEVVERIGEIVLDGSEDWKQWWHLSKTVGFMLTIGVSGLNRTNSIANSLTFGDINGGGDANDIEGYNFSSDKILIRLNKTKLNGEFTDYSDEQSVAFKNYLSQNPITIQYQLATESIKTVDLTVLDQNGHNVKQLMSFNGGTHFNTGSLEGSLLPSVSVSVETDLEETLKVCSLEGNTL